VSADTQIARPILDSAIDLASDPTISYASYQNSIPLIHRICVKNITDRTLDSVSLVLRFEPAFAETEFFRFERLEADELRVITPVKLRLLHRYLADLTEAENGRIVLEMRAGDTEIATANFPLTVLAYDQWAGTRCIPELLAAFSCPNNPHIDRLLGEAASLLVAGRGRFVMDGYSSKNRDAVWSQASAIYSAIAAHGLQYNLAPASFVANGQKIRTADRILDSGVANCLDLTMLLASCLEQSGLHPLILLKEGHAWLGLWLVNTCFPSPIEDDALTVRKRIDAGEMVTFETTGLAQHPSMTIKAAQECGYRYLNEEADAFRCCIDIKRSRIERINPLPSRDVAVLNGRAKESAPVALEALPPLPPLIDGTVLLDENQVPETPQGRLNRWKSKLLDLTLRNRLLNFKRTKVMIRLKVPDPFLLEDTLSDDREWKFCGMPALMEGTDPRSRSLALQREGVDPIEALAHSAMARHELLADLEQTKLDKALNEIFLSVKTGIEESGANTLFLALGFLRWAEDDRSEKTYLAPLVLVPVTLKRASVRSGFSLVRHDDETLVNPTLLQALRENYSVEIHGVEPPPKDAHGVDVEKIWAIFRQAVVQIPRWEVVPEVYLGVFSFQKYVMYTDLKNRADELRKSRIVSHLIDRPQEAFDNSDDPNFQNHVDLDDTYAPDQLLVPLSADASQLNALRRATEGRDFVLEGPPGTGKSQTITNLVADFLAKGKRVLFVSEKMAALEVVERRLREIGLGSFCLQLHSAKAVKTEVLDQLKQTLQLATVHAPTQWQIEVERLSRLRNELNGIARALHRVHENGSTVYDAINVAIQHRSWPHAPVQHDSLQKINAATLLELRGLAGQLQALAKHLGNPSDHPLSSIRRMEWSNGWQDDLLRAGSDLEHASRHLHECALELTKVFDLPMESASIRLLEDVEGLSGVLLQASTVPAAFAQRADDPAMLARVDLLRQHGEQRNQVWQTLQEAFKPEVKRLSGAELEQAWQIASAKWVVPRWFGWRALAKQLSLYTTSGKAPKIEAVPELLSKLHALNAEDEALHDAKVDAERLFGPAYQAEATDWQTICSCEKWARRLRQALDRFPYVGDPGHRDRLAQRIAILLGTQRNLLQEHGELTRRLQRFREALRAFRAAYQQSESLTGSPELADRQVTALDSIQSIVEAWRNNTAWLRPWCQWNGLKNKVTQLGFGAAIAKIEAELIEPSHIAAFIDYCYQLSWLKETIDRDDVLRNFSGSVQDNRIDQFRIADQQFQALTRHWIKARLSVNAAARIDSRQARGEMGVLNHQLQLQKRHIAIRKLVKQLPTVLPILKPCLLMSPLSVAQYLDPSYPPFDLVIFDEASQIPVWDAVGAIARGSQVVIVGDPRQLPPTAFFERGDDEQAEGDDEQASSVDLESILDETIATGMPRLSLEWHYRSRHESLIAFSNSRYYESRLITFPSPMTRDTAVRLVNVNGIYDRGGSQTNKQEAEAVVRRIVEHFAQDDPSLRAPTMGVVTFNANQMRLINELLTNELIKRPELEERIAAQGDERLFVKNLENVQGDERDIILFSLTYGRDAAGRSSMNFGPINKIGGERRLNVAITRARVAVEIYTSLRPEDIDLSRTRAKGVVDLKAYLEFALRGPSALTREAAPTGRDPDSPFEIEVISALRDAGWEVHPQVGCGGYRVDIGVVDRDAPGVYVLGVECDGASYHSMACARDRDRLRQAVLEGLGWKLVRVWSTDWWTNPTKSKAVLLEAVQCAQDAADRLRPSAPHSRAPEDGKIEIASSENANSIPD